MWSWVVSVAVGGALASLPQLSPNEAAAWRRIEPSVLMILSGDHPVGAAALIDTRGLFIAHRSVASEGRAVGRRMDGATYELTARASDDATQLVLLEASGWPSGAPAFTVATSDAIAGRLLAVVAEGPIRAQVSARDVVGMVGISQRATRLAALEFEVPDSRIGGALVFTLDGRLVGPLAGMLRTESTQSRSQLTAERRFGPGAIAVGYTLSPNVVDRVVEGFRLPQPRVQHPKIGVFTRDNSTGGAFVQSVETGSTAYLAGLRSGDIIVAVDGHAVRNQFDFSSMVFDARVGDSLRITYRRQSIERTVSVIVAS